MMCRCPHFNACTSSMHTQQPQQLYPSGGRNYANSYYFPPKQQQPIQAVLPLPQHAAQHLIWALHGAA